MACTPKNGTDAANSMFGADANVNGWTAEGTATFEKLHFDCIKTTVAKCMINMTQFQLRYEVAEALRAHYMEVPMIIPTNLLNYQRFPFHTIHPIK